MLMMLLVMILVRVGATHKGPKGRGAVEGRGERACDSVDRLPKERGPDQANLTLEVNLIRIDVGDRVALPFLGDAVEPMD
jgi:hypothetical protein